MDGTPLTVKIDCPLCHRVLPDVPEDWAHRPFCSPACRMADLMNWLNEAYRIPGPPHGVEEPIN